MGRLRIHPLFVIYVFLCVYFGWFNAIFYYVVSVVLHEYGHYFVAKKLGYSTQGIVLGVYGAGVQTYESFSRKNELLIVAAGPLVNLFLMVLIVVFWWVMPISYYYTFEFFLSNLWVFIFNILPLYPMDGGRCLACLLSRRYKKTKVVKCLSLISLIFGIVILALFLVSIFIEVNLNLLFVGLFMTINGIVCVRKYNINAVYNAFKNNKEIQQVKVFRVDNFDKLQMLKCLSSEHYSVFIGGKDLKDIRTQDDLLNM